MSSSRTKRALKLYIWGINPKKVGLGEGFRGVFGQFKERSTFYFLPVTISNLEINFTYRILYYFEPIDLARNLFEPRTSFEII